MQPPSVSTDFNFLITTFSLLMRCTPIAMIMVTTAGRPSGMAATAIATAVIKFCKIPALRAMSESMKMTSVTESTNPVIILPSLFSPFSSGVGPGAASRSMAAILPISVFMPVEHTTAVAVPLKTYVEENSMFVCEVTGRSLPESPS